jgi:hypothetical protein
MACNKSVSLGYGATLAFCVGLALPGLAQAQVANDAVLPADFRGQVTYDGYYEGVMTTSPRMPRNLDLNSILSAAASSREEPYRGSTRYVVDFDGNLLKGTIREQGSFNAHGTFTGTRQGTTCNLVNNMGIRMSVTCDKNRFYAQLSFTDNRGRKYRSKLEANRTVFVDYVERDKQRAIDAEKARIAAAEAAARYAALPSAPPALVQKFDRFVQTDAQGWAFNRYDAGSMRSVKIVSGKAGLGTYVMRGEYTYNGGQKGWVMAEMSGQNLSCIQFWDGVVGCRGLRTPGQGQAMRNAAVSAFLSSGDGSGQDNCNSACREGRDIQQALDHQRAIQQQIGKPQT